MAPLQSSISPKQWKLSEMSAPIPASVKLQPADNVIIATRALQPGDQAGNLQVLDNISAGHKIAEHDIKQGQALIKFGQTIGFATTDIQAGAHVHSHNMEFSDPGVHHSFCKDYKPTQYAEHPEERTFLGYHREDGSVGTRNYIAVLTSVNCSATAAHRIADAFSDEDLLQFENVDGVASFAHGTGCGMAGDNEGFANLQRVLWGYVKNPNVGGVLLVGLGCEVNQIDFLLDAYGLKQSPTFQFMNIQGMGGLRKTIEAGIEKVKAMLPEANKASRQPAPLSKLMVGLQCGGSDGWSGVTANPALGYATDLLVKYGGTSVLSETSEIYGAEHLLTSRAANQKIAEKLVERVRWWEDYTARNNGTMDNNPSPGNKRGGLTTILEKSLGAVAKGGTTALEGVYKYGEPIETKGFVFMDSPGYDPASVTGQIASGCNLIVFTTGRGSAFGSKPSPTIKVASNTPLFEHMPEDMDFNAGSIISDGRSVEEVGTELFELMIKVASGEHSKSEAQGLGDYEFVPWQIGAVM
ncbi:Altronate dehydratase [Pseudovibrio sp. Ad46]|nr:Altronate dehydratase [Pseudovibrio sp. Ad46]